MRATDVIKSFHAFILFWLLISCHSESPQQTVPVLDFSGIESQVIEKIDSLQNIVSKNPNSAGAWGKLGMNLNIHDLKEESIVCFERAARLDTSEFRWPYLVAYTHSVLHLDGALEWFARTVQLDRIYPPLYIRYGDALFKAGRIAEAESAYQKALDISPQYSHAYLGLAQVTFFRNEFKQSVLNLKKALAINPQHGEVYGLLATVYRRMKLLDQSNEAMRMARSFPADTKLNDPVISEVIKEGVSSYWFAYRGREYMARAKFYAAIDEFNQALKFNATADTYCQLGTIYRFLKQYDTAILYYRKALLLQPSDHVIARGLYSLYQQSGQPEQAEEVREKFSLVDSEKH